MFIGIIAIIGLGAMLLMLAVDSPCDISLGVTEANEPPITEQSSPFKMRLCSVDTENSSGNDTCYSIEIKGSVLCNQDGLETDLLVQVLDLSDGLDKAKAILTSTDDDPHGQGGFVYREQNGCLPEGWSVLSNWCPVATLNLSSLCYARQGERTLGLSVSIVSSDSDQPLATDRSLFAFNNPYPGYQDVYENKPRIGTLGEALAWTICKTDQKKDGQNNEIINEWRNSFQGNSSLTSKIAGLRLLYDKFFSRFGHLNPLWKKTWPRPLSKRLASITSMIDRQQVMELCFKMIASENSAGAIELTNLRNISRYLEIAPEQYRTMMEKLLPVTMHEVRDIELLLDISPQMPNPVVRQYLSKEYSKWNARVTHADSQIREQASIMLEIIAQARTQF